MICGIAIAVAAIEPWVVAGGSRPASGIGHTAISGVVGWRYQATSTFTSSFALVMLVAGALVFVAGLFASGVLAAVASVIALVASGVWIGLNASHYSPTSLTYSDLQLGAWLAIGGGLVGLISSWFVRGRQY